MGGVNEGGGPATQSSSLDRQTPHLYSSFCAPSLPLQGLEVIEAHYLFGVDYDNIDIVIHPQSIIHSMIETQDSSVLAQVGAGVAGRLGAGCFAAGGWCLVNGVGEGP